MDTNVWQNRIVGYGTSRAGDLLANEKNWRVHPKPQQDVLTGVLGDVGIVQNIIVNRRTSEEWGQSQNVETVLDGHLRVSLAISQSEDTEVPVTFVDLSPSEEALILATYDPIGALAVADNDQLKALIAECETDNAAVKALLEELAGVNCDDVGESGINPEQAHQTLAERFLIPPFSVLDARQGYWQDRKRAWLALGIKSELGRGGGEKLTMSEMIQTLKPCADQALKHTMSRTSPGGAPRPACDYSKRQRGDGRGRALNG